MTTRGRRPKSKANSVAPSRNASAADCLIALLKNERQNPSRLPPLRPEGATPQSCLQCPSTDRGGCRNKSQLKLRLSCPCDKLPVSRQDRPSRDRTLNQDFIAPFPRRRAPPLTMYTLSHRRRYPTCSKSCSTVYPLSAPAPAASGTRRRL